MARSVRAGETLAPRELATIASGPFRLPDPEHLVHLQFRRYSGCPICHLHLRSFANRHAEIVAAGVSLARMKSATPYSRASVASCSAHCSGGPVSNRSLESAIGR
jgi:hypothetical protein